MKLLKRKYKRWLCAFTYEKRYINRLIKHCEKELAEAEKHIEEGCYIPNYYDLRWKINLLKSGRARLCGIPPMKKRG